MSPQPTPTEHLEDLRRAVLMLVRHARSAGLEAPVPTCPDWTVRRLAGHLGAVHRRTTGLLRAAERGERTELVDVESDQWRKVAKTGRSSADPLDWLASGAITLVGALAKAAEDAPVPLLYDSERAPRPARAFWACRMCHETTIHAVDALAADLGRPPTPDEVGAALPISDALAVDGLDELLLELVPLGALRSPEPVTIEVRAGDVGLVWRLAVGPDAPPDASRAATSSTADDGILVLEGDARTLYLALWHRTPLESALWPLWQATCVL